MGPLLISLAALAIASGEAPFHQASLSAEAASSRETADSGETAQLFQQFQDQFYAHHYKEALATARKIPASDTNEGQAIVAAMRASASIGLKRDKEAAHLIAESQRLAPQSEYPATLLFSAGLVTGRTEYSAEALDWMIPRFSDAVRDIDKQDMWFFLSEEPKGQERRNEDRRIALAKLRFGGEGGDYLAVEAVGFLVKRGDSAGAAEIVKLIDDPRSVEDLLIQKRYSALWPQIEALAGPRLQKVRYSSAAAAEREYSSKTEDHERLAQLANTLRYAGRFTEAIAIRDKLPVSSEGMAEADEGIGWAANNVALALHAAGRADEADHLFALLNEASMPEGKGRWRVSMIINRLELLVADGKFDKAEKLLDLSEKSAANDGSPYAQQLVRRLRYCTLSRLGRNADATKLLPDVLKHAEDARGPTVDGLVCAGELDKAEELVLSSLKDDKFEGDFVRQLQARALTSDDPSVWQERWQALRQRPAIAAAFDRLGRDLPEEYLPPRL